MTTVAAALAEARALAIASLDGQLLLARVLAVTRSALIARDERELTADEERHWAAWRDRRAAGEPLAYLLGEKEFHGLVLEVTADVLVPRPETELLVDWAASLLATSSADGRASGAAPRVIDLGTGSGAIAIALKRLRPDALVVATDTSVAALAVARRNGERHGLTIELVAGSWWDAVIGQCFDVAVANPPYVAAGDPHLAELRHEPVVALSPGGGDGLDALRAIVCGARDHLAASGWLLVEHGFDQGAAVRDLFDRAGFVAVETRRDLAGHERTTAGRRTATA